MVWVGSGERVEPNHSEEPRSQVTSVCYGKDSKRHYGVPDGGGGQGNLRQGVARGKDYLILRKKRKEMDCLR